MIDIFWGGDKSLLASYYHARGNHSQWCYANSRETNVNVFLCQEAKVKKMMSKKDRKDKKMFSSKDDEHFLLTGEKHADRPG